MPATHPYETTASNLEKINVLGEAQNWRCCYCGIRCDGGANADNAATREHIVPKVSRKFAQFDGWENEVMACCLCNNNRGSMNSWTYYRRVKRKDREFAAKWAATRQRKRMRAHRRMKIAQAAHNDP